MSSKIQETLQKGGRKIVRKIVRAGGWKGSWGMGFSGYDMSISIINTQQLCLSAQNRCVQVHKYAYPKVEGGERDLSGSGS